MGKKNKRGGASSNGGEGQKKEAPVQTAKYGSNSKETAISKPPSKDAPSGKSQKGDIKNNNPDFKSKTSPELDVEHSFIGKRLNEEDQSRKAENGKGEKKTDKNGNKEEEAQKESSAAAQGGEKIFDAQQSDDESAEIQGNGRKSLGDHSKRENGKNISNPPQSEDDSAPIKKGKKRKSNGPLGKQNEDENFKVQRKVCEKENGDGKRDSEKIGVESVGAEKEEEGRPKQNLESPNQKHTGNGNLNSQHSDEAPEQKTEKAEETRSSLDESTKQKSENENSKLQKEDKESVKPENDKEESSEKPTNQTEAKQLVSCQSEVADDGLRKAENAQKETEGKDSEEANGNQNGTSSLQKSSDKSSTIDDGRRKNPDEVIEKKKGEEILQQCCEGPPEVEKDVNRSSVKPLIQKDDTPKPSQKTSGKSDEVKKDEAINIEECLKQVTGDESLSSQKTLDKALKTGRVEEVIPAQKPSAETELFRLSVEGSTNGVFRREIERRRNNKSPSDEEIVDAIAVSTKNGTDNLNQNLKKPFEQSNGDPTSQESGAELKQNVQKNGGTLSENESGGKSSLSSNKPKSADRASSGPEIEDDLLKTENAEKKNSDDRTEKTSSENILKTRDRNPNLQQSNTGSAHIENDGKQLSEKIPELEEVVVVEGKGNLQTLHAKPARTGGKKKRSFEGIPKLGEGDNQVSPRKIHAEPAKTKKEGKESSEDPIDKKIDDDVFLPPRSTGASTETENPQKQNSEQKPGDSTGPKRGDRKPSSQEVVDDSLAIGKDGEKNSAEVSDGIDGNSKLQHTTQKSADIETKEERGSHEVILQVDKVSEPQKITDEKHSSFKLSGNQPVKPEKGEEKILKEANEPKHVEDFSSLLKYLEDNEGGSFEESISRVDEGKISSSQSAADESSAAGNAQKENSGKSEEKSADSNNPLKESSTLKTTEQSADESTERNKKDQKPSPQKAVDHPLAVGKDTKESSGEPIKQRNEAKTPELQQTEEKSAPIEQSSEDPIRKKNEEQSLDLQASSGERVEAASDENTGSKSSSEQKNRIVSMSQPIEEKSREPVDALTSEKITERNDADGSLNSQQSDVEPEPKTGLADGADSKKKSEGRIHDDSSEPKSGASDSNLSKDDDGTPKPDDNKKETSKESNEQVENEKILNSQAATDEPTKAENAQKENSVKITGEKDFQESTPIAEVNPNLQQSCAGNTRTNDDGEQSFGEGTEKNDEKSADTDNPLQERSTLKTTEQSADEFTEQNKKKQKPSPQKAVDHPLALGEDKKKSSGEPIEQRNEVDTPERQPTAEESATKVQSTEKPIQKKKNEEQISNLQASSGEKTEAASDESTSSKSSTEQKNRTASESQLSEEESREPVVAATAEKLTEQDAEEANPNSEQGDFDDSAKKTKADESVRSSGSAEREDRAVPDSQQSEDLSAETEETEHESPRSPVDEVTEESDPNVSQSSSGSAGDEGAPNAPRRQPTGPSNGTPSSDVPSNGDVTTTPGDDQGEEPEGDTPEEVADPDCGRPMMFVDGVCANCGCRCRGVGYYVRTHYAHEFFYYGEEIIGTETREESSSEEEDSDSEENSGNASTTPQNNAAGGSRAATDPVNRPQASTAPPQSDEAGSSEGAAGPVNGSQAPSAPPQVNGVGSFGAPTAPVNKKQASTASPRVEDSGSSGRPAEDDSRRNAEEDDRIRREGTGSLIAMHGTCEGCNCHSNEPGVDVIVREIFEDLTYTDQLPSEDEEKRDKKSKRLTEEDIRNMEREADRACFDCLAWLVMIGVLVFSGGLGIIIGSWPEICAYLCPNSIKIED